MKNASTGRWMRFILTIIVFGLPSLASAQLTFNSVVVFGDSLSDPGNAFALITHPIAGLTHTAYVNQNTPPYDVLDAEFFVPSSPYARGGHHFTNGATWIEQYAKGKRFAPDVAAAFQSSGSKARNYAVGGARATVYPGRVNLPQQVDAFLTDVGGNAPADALYVIEIGGNDISDALTKFGTVLAQTGDQNQAALAAQGVISDALAGIAGNIQALYNAGARKFLVWNAAKLELIPAVTAQGPAAVLVAGGLSAGFNQALVQNVLTPLGALPDIQIAQLDIASRMAYIISHPGEFGLTNVTTPCITPNMPPFTCQQPDQYFFWDGLHPTKAVHAIISQLAADTLAQYPTP